MVNKRRLRELEGMVLPDHPEPATLYISDEREIALSQRAKAIRKRLDSNPLQDESLTFDQQIALGLKLYNSLTETERLIIDKETDFIRDRMRSILDNYYMPMFPKNNITVRLRICWFLREMDKLAYRECLEESEFNYNRDEDSPEFDDFAWWDAFDAKIKKTYPDGVFNEKSFEKLRNWFDMEEGKFMVQYWKDHPDEFKQTIKEMEKQVEAVRA